MDWGALPSDEIEPLASLAPCDPVGMMARLRGAFELRHADPERALRVAEATRAQAELRGHRLSIARADLVANYVIRDWDPDEMFAGLQRAHAVFREQGDLWGLARASDLLAFVYEGMGDYPTVLEYTQIALDAARRSGDRLFEANARSSLAGVLTAADDLDGARRELDLALEVADELGAERLRSRLLLRRGRLERSRGRVEAALEDLERALRVATQSESHYAAAEANGEIARTYEQAGDPSRAEARFSETLARLEGEVRGILGPPLLVGLARVRLALGRADDALEPLDELRILGPRYNSIPALAEGARLRADAQRGRGDFEAAYAALAEHLEHREQMVAGEAQRAVKRSQVKARLDAAHKDAEIHRLRYVELAGMQTQLLESERMAAVGSLAAGITHEMNTPLGAARSGLDTVRRAFARARADPADARAARVLEDSLQTAQAALDRLADLVQNLRRFTRLDEAARQRFDVTEGFEATVEVVRAQAPAGVRVEADLGPVPTIEGWPAALNQALLNLLTNAVEALGGAGRIQVTSRTTPQGLRVTVADDGPGVPEPLRARLFEPELTREGARARMRVGLPMVRSIVERHGGTVALDASVARGATFHVDLPG